MQWRDHGVDLYLDRLVRRGGLGSLPGRRIHVHLRADGPVPGHGGPAQASATRARRGLRRCQLRGPDGRRAGAHDGVRRLRRHGGGRCRLHRAPGRAERGARSGRFTGHRLPPRRGSGRRGPGRSGGQPRRPADARLPRVLPSAPPILGIVPDHLRHQTWLPAQSARGCWWGERRHCTFCGLNGSTMAYRSKSPDRLRRELAELSARRGTLRFYFVDNILDRRYIEEFLPALHARRRRLPVLLRGEVQPDPGPGEPAGRRRRRPAYSRASSRSALTCSG